MYVEVGEWKFDLNKNLKKNGFRRHTSKSPVDNKYKFWYTINTVKVGGRQSGTEGATSNPNGIVLKGNSLKQSQFLYWENKDGTPKKIYLISEFSGRHNGYGLRARYIGSIPRNPLIRR